MLPVHALSNTLFSYAFTATGGGSPKTWSITSGSVPTGITLDTVTGIISGTTASPGNYGFVLSVTDGSSTFSKRFTLVARDPFPYVLNFGLGGTQLPDVTVGQSYSSQLNPSGGIPTPTYAWTLASGSLPPGLSLISGAALPANYNPHVTLLGGAPTTVGLYSFTLQASDSAGNTIQRTFTLNVTPLNLWTGLRNPTYGSAYSQALTTSGGTGSYTYTVLSGLLPPGLTLSSAGLISGTPTNTGNWTFTVKVADSGGASFSRGFTLLVNATTAKTLDITTSATPGDLPVGTRLNRVLSASTINVPEGTGPYTWALFSGILPPGLSLVSGPSVSPDYAAGTTLLAGWPTTAGLYTYTLQVSDSSSPPNVGLKTITQRVSPMQAWYAPWPAVTAGAAFSFKLYPAGGTPPHTFALAPFNYLPAGVSLSSTGILSGATTLTGSFNFSTTMADSAGASYTFSRTLTVVPVGKNPPLGMSTSDGKTYGGELLNASVGANYLQRLDNWVWFEVPPNIWSLVSGSLPAGIVMIPGSSTVSGYLTGAPTAVEAPTQSLKVTDNAARTLTGSFKTTVTSVGLSPDPLPPATVGTPYLVALTPSGGTPPYSIQLRYTSSLPPGVTFSSGTLSGTPTAPGRFSGTFIVTDSTGAVLNRNYALYVNSAATPVPFFNLSPANIQIAYAYGETRPVTPVNITSGGAPVSFTAAVAGISGASLSVTSGTTPQTSNLQLPVLAQGTHYGVVEVRAPDAVNTPWYARVMVTVTPPPPCSFTVTPASATIASGGGTGAVTITTGPTCDWNASAAQAWITFTSATTGTGSGTVTYNVSSNPLTGQRLGTVTFSGLAPSATHTVTQFGSTCSYTIDPTSVSLTALGGAGTITVNASLAGCAWTATSNDPGWIQVTSGASGTGSGAVNIAVLANTTAINRVGTVTVAGLPFTVNQAGTACIVSLSSGGAEMPASGGSGSVNVSLPVGCNYSTVPGPSWLAVISGGSGSGPGGTVAYSVAANSSTTPRSGSLLIGGQPYQITQAGVACSFSITNDNPVFPYTGGAGSIGVAATAPACAWTASSATGWVTISAGASGTGNGTVTFAVAANGSTAPRPGTLTVAGQTAVITQAGVNCTYSLRSSTGTVPATGGSGSVGVVTVSACSWTATSNSPWLAVTSGGVSGSGDVFFTAQGNTSASERIGTLTVAGQTYTVTQPGAPCAYTLGSTSATVSYTGGTGLFNFFSTTGGCSPSAVSFASWIAATTSFSGTSGTVNFTVAEPNPAGIERSGIIQLGDQIFTVKQSAASCAFSLNSYGAIFNNAGGGGEVLASASAWGCTPAVGKSPEITLGLLTGPVNSIWTQPYLVPRYDSFVTWIRTLYISISGQLFTIKQTSWP